MLKVNQLAGFSGGSGGGGGTDPYFSSVISLLPLESDFVDIKRGAVWAAQGSCVIELKDGFNAAKVTPATVSFMNVPVAGDRTAFAFDGRSNNPWTAEWKVWTTGTIATGVNSMLSIGNGSPGFIGYYDGSRTLLASTTAATVASGGTVPTSQWVDISFCSNGSRVRGHIDGTLVFDVASTAYNTIWAASNGVYFGDFGSALTGYGMAGWLRELRFTGGIDRYGDANYTPVDTFPRS